MKKFPLFLRFSQITMGLLALFYILYIGQDIIIPLVFSLILAILLNPLVNYFTRHKINRIISICIAIVLMILLVTGIFYFIGSQVGRFTDSWPTLKHRLNDLLDTVLVWFSHKFNVGQYKVNKWVAEQRAESVQEASGMIGDTITTIGGMLVVLLLIPVYIFLFLFYKPLLLQFVAKIFSSDKHKVVADVLHQTRTLVQKYLVGLMIEMVIVATMNSTALLIIGIQYAVLLGTIGAILNLIPYIGGIIATALPMLMGLLTDDPYAAVWVLLAYALIQVIDNNFLVPKIVASKVKVNALVSIVVVLIGGALWGVAGMFLSIPLTAILKVIFDRVESLEPCGFLIGDTMPDLGQAIFKFNVRKAPVEPVIKPVDENPSERL